MARTTTTSTRTTKATGASPRSASLPKSKFPFLTLIDGLSSPLTYVIAAQKGTDGAVAIRNFGYQSKVKFYPNFAAFGFTQADLREKYAAGNYTDRQYKTDPMFAYERLMFPAENVAALLKDIKAKAFGPVASVKNIDLVQNGKEPETDTEQLFSKPLAKSVRKATPKAPVKATSRKSAVKPVSTRKSAAKPVAKAPVKKITPVQKAAPKAVAKVTTRKKYDPLKK